MMGVSGGTQPSQAPGKGSGAKPPKAEYFRIPDSLQIRSLTFSICESQSLLSWRRLFNPNRRYKILSQQNVHERLEGGNFASAN